MNVGIYIRVSTDNQVDRESLKTQESRLRDYCKAHRYTVFKVYKDAGVSARDTNRPALKRLLNAARQKKIDALLVTKLDRLTRSIKDLLDLLELFEELNMSFISASEHLDTSGPMGRFTLHLIGIVSQLEREMISERVSADMYHRASKGTWNGGIPPFGYRNVDKELKPDNKEKKIVKEIYKTYLERKSIRGTTDQINSSGHMTRKGEKWTSVSVHRILTNPVYIGKICYGKRTTDPFTGKLKKVKKEDWIVADADHEPIIEKHIYYEVQDLIVKKSRKPTRGSKTYMLSGILKCGKCGGSMYGYQYTKKGKGKGAGKTYFYYKCVNYSHSKGECEGFTVPGNEIEDFVVSKLSSMSRNRAFLSDKKKLIKHLKEQYSADDSQVKEQMNELKRQEKNLAKRRETLLDKLERETIDDEIFKERFSKIKSEQEALKEKRKDLQSLPEKAKLVNSILEKSFSEISDFKKNWQYLDDEGKKAKISSIVKKIVVTEKSMEMSLYMDPFGNFSNVQRGDKDSLPPRA